MPETISIVGKSGSGKTTLIEKLLPELKRRGYRIGTVKHAAHDIDMDKKGKDSWRHRAAGASTVAVASPHTVAVIKSMHAATIDDLEQFFEDMDLVITEGFKSGNRPKIEIFRTSAHSSPLCLGDPNLVAMMTDLQDELPVTSFGLDQIEGLADFIVARYIRVRLSATARPNIA